MGVLYLSEEGIHAGYQAGRIIIRKIDQELLSVPIEQTSGVVVYPGVQMSARLSSALLEAGISVTYLSSRGKYYGRLEPVQRVNIERQLIQIERYRDPNFCLELAKKFVSGKIHNSRVVIRGFARYSEADLENVDEDLIRIDRHVMNASTINELIGYEGNAAQIHYKCLSRLAKRDFKFSGRSRNPPRDPFNSMLSYGYTLLMYDIYALIQNHGLHPFIGFLHKPRNGHPTLASDLMEEWRPILVDAFVLHLVNRGTFQAQDFVVDTEGGVFLGHAQSKLFLQRYENRVKRPHMSPQGDTDFNYRIQLENQVKMLVRAIEENNPKLYTAYLIR